MVGQVLLVAFPFVPKGFGVCDGSVLPMDGHDALFSLIGTRYGGDGRTTFGLPKLDPPAPGLSYVIAMDGVYPSRK